MNLSESIIPRSDQLNADDLIAGPRTVTITEVRRGNAEQPVCVVTEEFGPGRPYKPSKSMRRVLVVAWGPDSAVYAGRQLTLFRNPKIKFGGDEVGGIQIAAMSHLTGPLTAALTVTRGKRAPFTVQPLGELVKVKDTSGRDWLKELNAAGEDLEKIGALGLAASAAHASEQTVQLIRATFVKVRGPMPRPGAAPAADQPPLVDLTDPGAGPVAQFVPTAEEAEDLDPDSPEYAAWEAEQLEIARQNGEVQ